PHRKDTDETEPLSAIGPLSPCRPTSAERRAGRIVGRALLAEWNLDCQLGIRSRADGAWQQTRDVKRPNRRGGFLAGPNERDGERAILDERQERYPGDCSGGRSF